MTKRSILRGGMGALLSIIALHAPTSTQAQDKKTYDSLSSRSIKLPPISDTVAKWRSAYKSSDREFIAELFRTTDYDATVLFCESETLNNVCGGTADPQMLANSKEMKDVAAEAKARALNSLKELSSGDFRIVEPSETGSSLTTLPLYKQNIDACQNAWPPRLVNGETPSMPQFVHPFHIRRVDYHLYLSKVENADGAAPTATAKNLRYYDAKSLKMAGLVMLKARRFENFAYESGSVSDRWARVAAGHDMWRMAFYDPDACHLVSIPAVESDPLRFVTGPGIHLKEFTEAECRNEECLAYAVTLNASPIVEVDGATYYTRVFAQARGDGTQSAIKMGRIIKAEARDGKVEYNTLLITLLPRVKQKAD